MPDRDVHKLHVIAPSRHAARGGGAGDQAFRGHRRAGGSGADREFNTLINDGLRVYQERELGGSGAGRAGRKPEFYSTSPATKVRALARICAVGGSRVLRDSACI